MNVPEDAVMEQLVLTWWEDYTLEPVEYIVTGTRLYIEMPPHSAIVLRTKGTQNKRAKTLTFPW